MAMVKQITEHLKSLGLGMAIIISIAAAILAVALAMSWVINTLGNALLPTIFGVIIIWGAWLLGWAIREDRNTEIIEDIPIPHYPKDRK